MRLQRKLAAISGKIGNQRRLHTGCAACVWNGKLVYWIYIDRRSEAGRPVSIFQGIREVVRFEQA
ncbi:hypothetical protein D3Z52_12630 [Clostridiaceae bacterium]|nr:hypothetical protein [Clostridiaceae bacterium]